MSTKHTLNTGSVLILHIFDQTVPDVAFEIHYCPPNSKTTCGTDAYAPIVRNGKKLVLNSTNTPLVLELPGEYRTEKITQGSAKIAYETVSSIISRGDVLGIKVEGL